MNNEFLKEVVELMSDYTAYFSEAFNVGRVSIEKNENYCFKQEKKQSADYENTLLEEDEYVNQTSFGDTGDWFEGIVLRKIKDTDYCLVLEYST